MIINLTSSYCSLCGIFHEACLQRDGNKVIGFVSCPVKEQQVQLSDDADIFLAIREKSRIDFSRNSNQKEISLLNYIEITNACNFKCPICYACVDNKNPLFISQEEALRRAKILKQAGGTNLTITGGEPTVHPELALIIKKIQAINLNVTMSSNGLLLSQDISYARLLKKSGLQKVYLQFDTFDKSVHQLMRGNQYIDEKLQAAENIINAGLGLGIIATVTSLNIHEIPRIVQFGLSYAPKLSTISFQIASPDGRYDLPGNSLVTRERTIKELLSSNVLGGITVNDFWPLPVFKPWNLRLHPDCAANIYVMVKQGSVKSLAQITDLGAVFERLNRNSMRPSWFSKYVIPLYYLLKNTNSAYRFELLKCLINTCRGKGKSGVVLIGVGSFVCKDFQDEQRLRRCATSLITANGIVSPCFYYLNNSCDNKGGKF